MSLEVWWGAVGGLSAARDNKHTGKDKHWLAPLSTGSLHKFQKSQETQFLKLFASCHPYPQKVSQKKLKNLKHLKTQLFEASG